MLSLTFPSFFLSRGSHPSTGTEVGHSYELASEVPIYPHFIFIWSLLFELQCGPWMTTGEEGHLNDSCVINHQDGDIHSIHKLRTMNNIGTTPKSWLKISNMDSSFRQLVLFYVIRCVWIRHKAPPSVYGLRPCRLGFLCRI
ncbi:hypothetical protein MPTK1_2g23820 [Marchantia polymorpha subsp. ruderalis]|uniref:Uncharacterized protein n=1 Tax=Marchantia polymorpha TaxID=3197 RepID=A0A2R6WP97_MARPO|nr:hypothetical protein MARPO_0069s0032 [Marchantia polymorpha]BBN03480.1 hypothetical protein Mp_2g23820 [Marchantia polymorpha subsp. ruderalis]|eukprot:PTQ35687.1 hypothetical protein MARPO_0069s0032 [Marchantia polymorpha]